MCAPGGRQRNVSVGDLPDTIVKMTTSPTSLGAVIWIVTVRAG